MRCDGCDNPGAATRRYELDMRYGGMTSVADYCFDCAHVVNTGRSDTVECAVTAGEPEYMDPLRVEALGWALLALHAPSPDARTMREQAKVLWDLMRDPDERDAEGLVMVLEDHGHEEGEARWIVNTICGRDLV
ncbi:MAG: hypothetical protein ACOC9H_02015 [Gemmatimonadota bacterium]